MLNDVLNDSRISRLIELALLEDVGLGDLTSEAILHEEQLARGEFLCKAHGVIAGLEVATLVFQYCDHSITLAPTCEDGTIVPAGTVVARIDGDARSILRGERTALNFIQRMSGIATQTREFVRAVDGTRARITDTRKTVPGLRVLDKWAVRIGGGVNHRFGLDDMILIKDNHIAAAGGIDAALRRCRQHLDRNEFTVPVEVETRTLPEVQQALDAGGFQRIMLDNFTLDDMQRAVQLIGRRYEVEASGGISLATVRSVAETGVDFISVGALTHSVKALDISLELHDTDVHPPQGS